jgi:V/A-type H+-transporting ATPase subunit I
MFKPLPMQRIELSLLKDDAPQAALLLANCGSFDPEISEIPAEQFPELPGEAYRQLYTESRTHLDKVLAHYKIDAPEIVAAPMQTVSPQQLSETGLWLKLLWGKCSEEQEYFHQLRDEYRHATQLLKVLEQFTDININLALLQKRNSLLDVRVGTLPQANIQRFEEALALASYTAIRFSSSEEHIHMIIAGVRGQSREIERVLQAAGWRTIEIPPEFHGSPDEVRRELSENVSRLTEEYKQETARRLEKLDQEKLRERLLKAAHLIARAAPYAELADLMRGRGELVSVSGWVPDSQLPHLKKMLAACFGNRFVLLTRNPRTDEQLRVPSAIHHPAWLRPFASLVLNYGVPRYGEIDPTILFAITFVLMFGMMFGDVGHGLTIALAGILLRRRLGQYTTLAIAIGLSSTIFGLLYGSVFGFEQVLPALWISPLSDPMRMLGVALVFGMTFILLATLLTIRNRIADGRLREALFDSHGASGLLLYAGLLSSAWQYAAKGHIGIAPLLIACTALALIFTYSWQHSRNVATGERLLIAAMEGYEASMSYISNTLSFLRLAAFSLNHVALSIAIFTVANMLQTTGYWVSVVLGNLFILGLEGAIVGIQTLRLEYYEGFSRFFSGDGRAFRPLTLGKRQQGVAFQN